MRAVLPVGGDPVHVMSEGSGDPAVLLISGVAGHWFDWDRVVQRLVGEHRLARFDRPGMGLSPPGRGLPDLAAEARRIAALVEVVQLGAPVLVAHSAGALVAEAYARLYPGAVSGLVLVDPSWAAGTRPRPPVGTTAVHAVLALARGATALAQQTGLLHLLGPVAWRLARRAAAADPWEPRHGRAVYRRAAAVDATVAELLAHRDWLVDLDRLRAERPAPAVPVIVLTALGDVRTAAGRRAWVSGHRRLARLFGPGEQVVLPRCRHLVAVDQPAAVAEAITTVAQGHPGTDSPHQGAPAPKG